MKKLSFKDRLFVASMAGVMVIGLLMPAIRSYAVESTSKPTAIYSQGKLQLPGEDGSYGTGDDIIVDSNDLYWLYEYCK